MVWSWSPSLTGKTKCKSVCVRVFLLKLNRNWKRFSSPKRLEAQNQRRTSRGYTMQERLKTSLFFHTSTNKLFLQRMRWTVFVFENSVHRIVYRPTDFIACIFQNALYTMHACTHAPYINNHKQKNYNNDTRKKQKAIHRQAYMRMCGILFVRFSMALNWLLT